MATPPPEGATALKEEKPQAPPQLNDVTPASSLNRSPDSLLNGDTRSEEKSVSAALNKAAFSTNNDVVPSTNGETPPIANGTEGIPAPDSNTASSIEAKLEIKPQEIALSPPKDLGGNVENTVSEPAANISNSPKEIAQQSQSDAETTLPHHAASANESTPPQVDFVDQPMTDAPLSPAKVSREREVDPEEEPAAKRAKVNGGAPAELDTKATDASAPPEAVQPTPSDAVGITPLQHKFLIKALTNLKRSNDSRFYREPVDPIKLNIPNYFTVVTEPMDLSKIDEKLKKNEYTSVSEIVSDVELMTHNAVKFNGPDHVVSLEGVKLKHTFQKQLEKLPKPDEVEEKKPKKLPPPKEHPRREPRLSTQAAPKQNNAASPTFALNPEGLPIIRRDSTNADGRPKRAIQPPKRDLPYSTKPKKKKFQWELKFCQELLDELHKPKYWTIANPFYYPVDPVALNIPTYHSVIKKPMDLSTVQTKLKAGQYENAKEMEADVRLMLKNCFKFNIPGDPIYVAGQNLEEIFNAKWANKSHWLEEHDPDNHTQSASSDEDSEEEESEEDADQEKLQALQRQIAEMSKQVEAITRKKKTPPASKKAGKPKSGKKESKKGSKSDKKAKGSKSDKRNVTYHEKQVISNGISLLPDKKMQEALRIIQNNVPSLKGTQETEIELDIDELPNEVLVMLLKFVKKNAPQAVVDDYEDVSAPVSASVQSKPKKNKPMSKFEQEAQINMLEGSLSRFQGGASTEFAEPMHSAEPDSTDESDDDSEESEEE
ncbi:Bromodomain-containing protein [Talaromyces proteolyticus]|uniref:Bromodomain-containing protein n=1 Tax=Talaromyces proteolyticus TaxID=1131652 RepID=A0AAD4PYF6_9EURO|nr:Bromodomain-containing protein [Talaromyces proteolyticus]KAH8697694.1 Bromodomain-containing protein [Talaromyces proteolyticus]